MRIFFFTSLLLLASSLKSQDHKNNIQVEIGGSGLLYSVSYERIEWKQIAFRAGISFFSIQERQTNKYFSLGSLPIQASYLLNIYQGRHYIEFGLGANLLCLSSTMNSYIRETDYYLNPNAIIGYRFHSPNGKWIYKAAFTPFYGTASLNDKRPNQQAFSLLGKGFQVWGGLSVGYRF